MDQVGLGLDRLGLPDHLGEEDRGAIGWKTRLEPVLHGGRHRLVHHLQRRRNHPGRDHPGHGPCRPLQLLEVEKQRPHVGIDGQEPDQGPGDDARVPSEPTISPLRSSPGSSGA